MTVRRALRTIRRASWRVSSAAGDAEAIASGNPSRVAKRYLWTKPKWRLIGRLGRRLP